MHYFVIVFMVFFLFQDLCYSQFKPKLHLNSQQSDLKTKALIKWTNTCMFVSKYIDKEGRWKLELNINHKLFIQQKV